MSGPHNKALHQTRRGGVLASRAVVEARLAGEGWCSTGMMRRAIFICATEGTEGLFQRLRPKARIPNHMVLASGVVSGSSRGGAQSNDDESLWLQRPSSNSWHPRPICWSGRE